MAALLHFFFLPWLMRRQRDLCLNCFLHSSFPGLAAFDVISRPGPVQLAVAKRSEASQGASAGEKPGLISCFLVTAFQLLILQLNSFFHNLNNSTRSAKPGTSE